MAKQPLTQRQWFRTWVWPGPEPEPMSNRRYIVQLILLPVPVLYLTLGIVSGAWWMILFSVALGANLGIAVYRERQRRMRVRDARKRSLAP